MCVKPVSTITVTEKNFNILYMWYVKEPQKLTTRTLLCAVVYLINIIVSMRQRMNRILYKTKPNRIRLDENVFFHLQIFRIENEHKPSLTSKWIIAEVYVANNLMILYR